MDDRRTALAAQEAILRSRIAQARSQVGGLREQRASLSSQSGFIQTELDGLRTLFAKGLVTRSRLFALEREKARLRGAIGQSDADVARTQDLVLQTQQELTQLRGDYNAKLAEDLATSREKIAELGGKAALANDVLSRVLVRAPIDGVIQSLQVNAIGEVVQPGGALMEIAPVGGGLIVSARVRPTEVEGVARGMAATFRLSGLPGRTTPVADGRVLSVSRDRLVDANTGEAYFLLRASISEAGLDRGVIERLTAGMPVEVVVPTEGRTLLSYLFRPLADAFHRAFRER